MTVLAFATLRTYQITESSGVFTLVRNFGSSLFISVAVVLLVRSTTENYGRMTIHQSIQQGPGFLRRVRSLEYRDGQWSHAVFK
jgi:hypothetical protein